MRGRVSLVAFAFDLEVEGAQSVSQSRQGAFRESLECGLAGEAIAGVEQLEHGVAIGLFIAGGQDFKAR